MLTKADLLIGGIYATVADQGPGNNALYIGRKEYNSNWSYMAPRHKHWSDLGNLENNCFNAYRTPTFEELCHFLECERLRRYVPFESVKIPETSEYQIF